MAFRLFGEPAPAKFRLAGAVAVSWAPTSSFAWAPAPADNFGVISLRDSYLLNDNGQRSIPVDRIDGSDGLVGCDWVITGPNASAFNPANGQVEFADGQVIDQIVTTISDLGTDGSATITLTNPTGGAILGNATAPITILDYTLAFTPAAGFSVSGTFENDEIITITDAQSRFGSKPFGAKPLYVVDAGRNLDGGTDSRSRRTKAGSSFWAQNGGTGERVTNFVKPGSLHSYRTEGDGSGYITPIAHLDISGTGGRYWYSYIDHYNDWDKDEVLASSPRDPPGINVKWARWHYGDQSLPYTPNNMQASTFRWYFKGDGQSIYSTTYGLSMFDTHKWWSEEQLMRTSSSAGATDAQYKIVYDGGDTRVRSNVDSHDGRDPSAYNWTYFKTLATQDWAQPGVCFIHYDLIYIDDSWCRIFISELPTWDDSVTHLREIQPPNSWSANAVSFSMRLGRFAGSLAGKYLWVADQSDNRYLIGQFT